MEMPPAEIGTPKTSLTELPAVLRDTDMGVFVLDRQGVVRYRNTGAYINDQGLRTMPSMDDILKAIQEAAAP